MCLSSSKPIISKVKSYLPSHHSIHTNSISNECCVQSNHSTPPPPTKHSLATLLCVLVLLFYVSKISSVLLQKKKKPSKTNKMLATDQSMPKFGSGNFSTFHFPTLHTGEINYSRACSTIHVPAHYKSTVYCIALHACHTLTGILFVTFVQM